MTTFEADVARIEASIAQIRPTDVADRLLAIWHAACHSAHRSPFARLGDDVHAEALTILAEHGVTPTPVQARHLRLLCGFEVATVVSFVEMIVGGRERVTP